MTTPTDLTKNRHIDEPLPAVIACSEALFEKGLVHQGTAYGLPLRNQAGSFTY